MLEVPKLTSKGSVGAILIIRFSYEREDDSDLIEYATDDEITVKW